MEKRAPRPDEAGHWHVFNSAGSLYDMVSYIIGQWVSKLAKKKETQKYKKCIVKRKGHIEEFDERKAYASVYAACASAHYDESGCEKTADSVTKAVKKLVKNKKKILSSKIRERISA